MFGPRPLPLSLSVLLHGAVLASVILALRSTEKPQSLYQQVIAPNYQKLVWYKFRDKLPEVSPLERHGISQPPKTEVQVPRQTFVARSPQAPPARQLIWEPAPPLQLRQDLKLPNLMAFEARRIPKPFTPPPAQPRIVAPPALLPTPPKVEVEKRQLKLDQNPIERALGTRPKPRSFVPPKEQPKAPVPLPLAPAAPEVRTAGGVDPKLALDTRIATALAFKPQPRAFAAPPASGGEVQAVEVEAPSGSLTAAVVGLNPVDRLQIPIPEASRPAQFSGGPATRAQGGDGEPVETAKIFVPDLMIRGGARAAGPALMVRAAPTSRENLAAAMTARAQPAVAHVVSGPDPQWAAGRDIYTMAIQMPNVTSYAGSWIIWFVEKDPATGKAPGLVPPVPVRKVDPKYNAAARADRVEGKVQLYATIRKDGHVDQVSLLKHLDDRLDSSAMEAMRKWEFEPATKDGRPVDVDAVVEIPFRLAPLVAR